ncbi:TolC family protein [bacterium]|nr:TolC family protein [bacterium]
MKFKYVILLMILPLFLNSLTLEEAERITQEKNKEIKIAQENKAGSFSNYKSIKGNLYPQLSLSGSYGLAKTDVPDILPAGSMAEKEMPLNTVLSMNQILFSSDVFNGLKAAKVYNNINDTMLNVTVRNVLFQTRRLFNTALLTKEIVVIHQEALEIANAQYTRVSNMYEQGLVSEYDKLRAELQVSELDPKLQEAMNNYQLSIQALQNHLGDEVEISEIEGELTEPVMQKISLDQAIKEGLDNRLELDATQLNVDILDIQYQNQKKSYLPSLALTGSITNFTATSDYEVEADNFGNKYSIAVGFQMPLFTGFTNVNKANEYKYQLNSARLETSVLYDNIKLEIKNHYLSLEKDKINITTAKKNRDLARRGLTIAEQMYANQLGTYLDVQSAQLSYNQAQLNYISAVYSLIDSYESLLKAMGINFRS